MTTLHVRISHRILIATTIAFAFALSANEALAQKKDESVGGEVLVVLAKEKGGDFDASLKSIGALRRPPFSSFKSMSVLERPKVRLAIKKPTDVKLPNGRTIQVLVERELPDGRYLVKVSINKPGKKDYLRLLQVSTSPGDPFFVVGQSHAGGTLVVGITVGVKPSADKKAADKK